MTHIKIIKQFSDFDQLLYIIEFCNDPELISIQSMDYDEILNMYNGIHVS